MRLGYVGLGNMGGALARRLMLKHKLTVFDARTQVVQAFAKDGAQPAKSAAEVAKQSDLVLLCLPTSNEVRDAVFGPGGVAEGIAKGGVVADMTTGDPLATRELAKQAEAGGFTLVDAPVSGGPQGATGGTIAIMVGAPASVFEKIKEPLLSISPNVVHCGEVGAGHVAKLCNNMLAAICRTATFEAMSLAVKNGLDPKVAVQVLQKGSGRNYATDITFPRNIVTGDLDQGFTLGLMHKDVRLATQLGTDSGVPLFIGNLVRETFQALIGEHGKDADINQMTLTFERLTGARIRP
jgi:3-hydroxyisobutyrate dehydrogenase